MKKKDHPTRAKREAKKIDAERRAMRVASRKGWAEYRKEQLEKGIPPSELRLAILAALSNSGGVEYLMKVAQDAPASFLQLLARVVPAEVNQTIQHSLMSNEELVSRIGQTFGETAAKEVAQKMGVRLLEGKTQVIDVESVETKENQ